MGTIAAEYAFWVCLLAVAYTYFLYPLLLFVFYSLEQIRRDWQYLKDRHDRRPPQLSPDDTPGVSLIVPAYNEENHLGQKIGNVRELAYPSDKLEVIFVSDGSTDGTNEILGEIEDRNIQKVFLPVRQGKPTALNEGAARAKNDILVFSDAGTLFAPDALQKLVRHFSDSRVGVVCGALRLEGTSEFRQTEGLYWKYESMLRLMENRLGATLTASGAIYALRRQCYRPPPANVLIEDFVIPMNARKMDYRVLYDPEAVGRDFGASSVSGEFTRRVRLAVGSFRALGELLRIPFQPFTLIAFVSHKLLRWLLPFFLIGLLLSSGILWSNPFYRAASIAQLAFYVWAGIGFVFKHRLRHIRYALTPYYLVAIHLAFMVGFVRFLFGVQEPTWRRVD